MGAARPPHLRWQAIALVVVGGTLGAASREGIILALPSIGDFPVAIFVVNVLGAFLLGLLLESLTRRRTAGHRAAQLRALLGTGFCGGFTTYSALAVDSVLLGGNGQLGLAVAYALGTVVVGACATWAGIALGASLGGGRADAAGSASGNPEGVPSR